MNPRYRVFALLGVVLLLSLAFYAYTTRGNADNVLIGTVDANQVIVSSKVAGRIEKLLVDEGQTVAAGQVIARIDNADLAAERDSARATLESLQHQVRQSGESYASTHGETNFQVQNAESSLAASEASLAESEAVARQQELDTRRTVALAEQGVASQQDRDHAVESLKADQARVVANRKQVDAARATVSIMRARLNQAAAAHSNVAATEGQMASASAKLQEAEIRLGYTTITAPVSGVVSVRAAREGEVVGVGTPIVTLVDLRETWVYAAVPETAEQTVKLGDTLDVRMPGGEKVQGKVIAKAAEADFATERDYSRTKRDIKTVRVKLLIPNPKETYVPGMTAEVFLPRAKGN
ncbi:MAG: efflux RND transporter periplasmic adaptor subunit [Acidobacteriota bacterium]|nr:efflux RND transporter periplasmic adaptor subunit [Acidobacteriota bacterium]